MVSNLFSLEVHQRYGYFWSQGIKLHYIKGCHFLFGSDTLIRAPLMGAGLFPKKEVTFWDQS